MIRKSMLLFSSSLTLLFGGSAALADPFETFVGVVAKSPEGVVAAIDQFFATDEAEGYRVFLVESVFDGDRPATHFVVGEYDSFASYEALVERRENSLAWHQAVAAFTAATKPVANGIGITRAAYGEGWPDRDNFVAVFDVAVTDAAKYAKAFDKLANSDIGKKAPGITRLMETRYAPSGASHYVLMSGPSFAALNEHLDMMFASDEYDDFNDDVKNIRKVVGTALYRKVKAWSK